MLPINSNVAHCLSNKCDEENNADIWDDTLLIKAYNDSLQLGNEEVAKNIARSTNAKILCSNKNSESECSISVKSEPMAGPHTAQAIFKIGDYVRSTYVDNIDYEAEIINIDGLTNMCLLKYIGYGNEQIAKLDDLLPSWGKKARKKQMQQVMEQSNKHSDSGAAAASSGSNLLRGHKKRSKPFKAFGKFFDGPQMPPIPPMPSMMDNMSEDSECLSAMLMSWYLSGYYTGIYHGRKQALSSLAKNKK